MSGKIRATSFDRVSDFLERCEAWLLRREAQNNSILNLARITQAQPGLLDQPFWFGAVERCGAVAGCAMHVRPDGLLLPDMEDAAVAVLVQSLLVDGIDVERICGPERTTIIAAESIASQAGRPFAITEAWQSFVTAEIVEARKKPNGALRQATPDDCDRVSELAREYNREKPALIDIVDYFKRKLHEREVWCWDDNGIRTILAVSGKTRNGIRIAGLFTAEPDRRKGYGSAAVAHVTRHFLNEGCEFVTLLVDRRDPEVMRLYERLGYRPLDLRIEMRPQCGSD